MNKRIAPLAAIICSLVAARAEIPNTIPHQGRVVVGNTNFHGLGEFKFLLFHDEDTDHSNGGEIAIWANDSNTGVAFAEPVTGVSIPVQRGLYATRLGDSSMTSLPASIEPPAGNKLYLRIWFDGGTGTFQALSPDIEFGSVPMALHSRGVTAGGVDSAAIADGSVTATKIADGAVSKLGTPDGSTTDAVQVTDDGGVGVGTTSPEAGLHVATATPLLLPAVQAVLIDEVGGFDFIEGVSAVASFGTVMAVSSRVESSVTLIDISDPTAPVLKSVLTDGVGGFDHLGGASSLSFNRLNLAIGAYEDDSVTIVDATDPTNPILVHVLTDGVGGFDDLDGVANVEFKDATAGSELVIAAELDDAVTLVENPLLSPAPLITIKDGQFGFDDLDGARSVTFSGDLMAVAAFEDDSVNLIDISVPTNPVLEAVMKDGVGAFSELDRPAAVAFNGSVLAIAAVGDDAVTLVETGALPNPTTTLLATLKDGVGGYDSLAGTRAVTFGGDLLAVVSTLDDAVTLVDVADPANPILEATIIDGRGPFNDLDGPRSAIFTEVFPDTLVVPSFADNSVTLIDTAPTGAVGAVIDDWLGVGTAHPQAALHVSGGLIVDNRGGLIDLAASHLELGADTSASGLGSLATGKSTTAGGNYSTAMGRNTKATGSYSFSAGRGTLAPSGYEVALGRYNTDYTPVAELGWDDADRIFVIGNGTGLDARSDLLTITKGGQFDLDGSADFTGNLSSDGDIDAVGKITGGDICSDADVTAAGDLIATGDFKYASTKTCYLQVPATAFDSDIVWEHTSNYIRNNDGSIYMANVSDMMKFFAPVQLPDDATITKVEFAYRDNSSDQDFSDIDFYLRRAEFGQTGSVEVASVTNLSTSGQSSTVVIATDSAISFGTIDNQNYHYYLQADLDVTLARTQLTFHGARITYTVSKLGH